MKFSNLLRDRRLWLALGVIAILIMLRATGLSDQLSLETLARHREALAAFVAANLLLAAGAYVLLYVVAVAFSVPGAVFITLSGGFLFGAIMGTALTVVGATIGATLIFLFAQRIFGADALDRLGADTTCRAVLLTGAEGHFAAGADIGEIEHKSSAEGAVDPRKAHWAAIRAFPKPLVAAVDGFALGGGFELALMADVMVLGATARVGLPETNLGLIPGAGGGQRLMALAGRARAMRLVLTGEIIDARTAHDWGIAASLSDGAAGDLAGPLTERLATRAPLALMAAKQALVAGEECALALAKERAAFESLLDTEDKTEGIRAFRDRRKPEFRGK